MATVLQIAIQIKMHVADEDHLLAQALFRMHQQPCLESHGGS